MTCVVRPYETLHPPPPARNRSHRRQANRAPSNARQPAAVEGTPTTQDLHLEQRDKFRIPPQVGRSRRPGQEGDRQPMCTLLLRPLSTQALSRMPTGWTIKRVRPLAIGTEEELADNTVAQITQSERKEMLEVLGDPDEGPELRQAVREGLIRQREAVVKGQLGQPLEDVTSKVGLD